MCEGRSSMIILKSCPRCHGDMMQEELLGDTEFVCLQCGFRAFAEARLRPEAPGHAARKAA